MAKNSTLFSNVSISRTEENLNEKVQDNQYSLGDVVISNILNFSKALRVERSREVGLIELVLN